MADADPTPRYAAFISYNHRDRKVASWLHRQLETYRFPKRLRGRPTRVGPLGARLPPIFQDREELAASSDLAASVQDALDHAASLIVICSPDGARSRWVNEEIRAFTRLGRRDRIQCLIVGGEPNASRLTGADASLECLPPALFEDGGGEPLASDIRPGQDGRAAAKLKLLAGITGIGYDELRQREQARRQRRLLAATAILGSALILMTALAVYAWIARNEAIAQRDIARSKTLTAERTVDFVKSMFAVADPSEAKGDTITAREILDRGAVRIDRELTNEPATRAELETTLGEVYTNLGLFGQGSALIERGLQIPDLAPGLRARQYLALGTVRSWQANDEGAEHAYLQSLALARDPGSDRGDLLPRILSGLGETQGYLGKTATGEANIRQALAADQRRGRDGELDLARDLEALGLLLYGDKRYDAARTSYERALRIRETRQGMLYPLTGQDLNQLASIAYMRRDGVRAEQLWRQRLPLAEKVLGPDHPEVAATLNNIARVLIERRAYAGAVPMLRRAVQIQEAQRGAETGELVFPLLNLAIALRETGDEAEAETLLEQDRAIAAQLKHRNLGPVLIELGDIACHRGDRTKARTDFEAARTAVAKDYAGEPWRMAWLDLVEGQCLGNRDQIARARPVILARWSPATHFGARARE